MTELREKTARYLYMDVLRIVGCILVVCLHVGCLDADNISISGPEWPVINFFDSLGMAGISFFFMLSGALFLQSNKEISLKYLWKKIAILLAVYLGTLFFYNITPFLKGWVPFTWEYIKIDLIEKIIYGKGVYHLWFLPTLMVLYALSPLLKDAFRTKKNCEYFLILFFVFGGLLSFLLLFNFPYVSYLQSFQDRFALYFLTGHLGLFVLGHYLHEYMGVLSAKKRILAIGGVVASMVFTILFNHLFSMKIGAVSMVANTPLSPHGLVFAVSVYLLVKSMKWEKVSEKKEKRIKLLSSLTFGIYLLHPFVVTDILHMLALDKFIGNYFLLVFSRILIVLVISGILTFLLKKLPILRKVL